MKSNGRKSEHKIFTELVKVRPRWFVYRFNENRFKATPADIIISTPTINIMVEVKSTIRKYIQKANIREGQIKSLKKFDCISKNNLSVIWLCYKGPKHVIVNVNRLNMLKYKIDFESVCNIGTEVKDWNKILTYFKRELYYNG